MKKRYIIAIIVALAVIADLFVLLYPTVSDYFNSRTQSRVVTRYIDDVEKLNGDQAEAMLEAARAYNRDLLHKPDRFQFTDQETADYMQQLNTGRNVMGILVIDKINVKLPIYHQTDESVLQVGLGHIPGTSLPVGGAGTHTFITGHRGLPSSTLLTDLDKMAEGDTFVLYVMGETLTYQVDQIQTVLPQEMEALDIDPTMDYCTLVTCTPYGVNDHRLLVRGRRVENATTLGWESLYADADQMDKITMIGIFIAPILPVLIVLILIRYIKIHKKGKVQ